MEKWQYVRMTAILGTALFLSACNEDESQEPASTSSDIVEQTEVGTAQLNGDVVGDGSSTVAPITEALVEEYADVQGKVRVAVGVSGTGGGFEKFLNGETDFSNASRPIKDEEAAKLKDAGIDYTEFKLANDGLTVVINQGNDWAKNLTIDQLKQIWIENGTEKKWSDIDSNWPNEEIVYYAPGTDSGTYDYFDEEILDGEDLVSSAMLSEDDNVLVQGVAGDKNAIAFFGYAYYVENEDQLTAVAINGVEPNANTIESNEYSPLSRPLFVYVKNSAVKDNEAVYDFIKFTLENAGEAATDTGYVKLQQADYDKGLEMLESLK